MRALRKCRNHLFDYVRPNGTSDVDATMAVYDFFGLAERFDESLLAMKKVFRLSLGDILYLPSKRSGANQLDGQGHPIPRHPPLSEEPKKLRRAIRDEIVPNNDKDIRLWKKANRTLQSILDTIPNLRNELALFRHLLDRASLICSPKPCLYRDHACGYPCLDRIAKEVIS